MKSVINTKNNYRHSIEGIKEYGIFILDSDGRIASWGRGAQHHLGYKEREIVNRHFASLFRDNNLVARATENALKLALAKGNYHYQERCVRKNGRSFWGSIALTVILDKLGKHQGYSVILRDTTDEMRTQHVRLHQSTHDFLTGLPNRRYLEENLKELIRQTRKNSLLGVLFLDFNNFKRVNDMGHKYGDLVLAAIADRLKNHVREEDIVSRLGGDEFIIVLTAFKNIEDMKVAADKVLKLFQKPIKIGKNKFNVSVSIGIAVCPTDGRKVDDLLHHSDMALYQAKKNGGNRYELYSKKLSG